MKHLPVLLAGSLSAGILLAEWLTIGPGTALACAGIFLCLVYLTRRRNLLFSVTICALGIACGLATALNFRRLPACHICNYAAADTDKVYTTEGLVVDEPRQKGRRVSFILEVKFLQEDKINRTCCGKILVQCAAKPGLHYGQRLLLRGEFLRPQDKYASYLSNQGVRLILRVKTSADLIILKEGQGNPLFSWIISCKEILRAKICQRASPLCAGILRAMVLGDKDGIPWFVNNLMLKTGTLHILVVSGFNVGIVAFVIELILKALRLRRLPRRLLLIPLLFLYCLITGVSNPVLRATIMATAIITGKMIKRDADIYNSLALAAMLILGANPRQLFDAGFQLSFASVWAIAFFYPLLKRISGREKIKARWMGFLADAGLVSASAWIGTAGLIAYYFRIFSPVSIPANIFIVPLASLITLGGFSLLIAEYLATPLAVSFACSCEILCRLLLYTNAWLLKIPFAYYSWR